MGDFFYSRVLGCFLYSSGLGSSFGHQVVEPLVLRSWDFESSGLRTLLPARGRVGVYFVQQLSEKLRGRGISYFVGAQSGLGGG